MATFDGEDMNDLTDTSFSMDRSKRHESMAGFSERDVSSSPN